jgi:hypothetical protein
MRNDTRRYYDGEEMEMATTEKPPCLPVLSLSVDLITLPLPAGNVSSFSAN